MGKLKRILWHSNHPGAGTGYGVQTELFVPRIAALGYEVAISCFFGQQVRMDEWRGHTTYGSGATLYGGDVVGLHARHFGADLVITLMDQWALGQETLIGVPTACWMPVDASPLSQLDRQRLPGRWPIAMSQFGVRELEKAGYRTLYVPHGIDTAVFRPPDDRKALRTAMGVDDKFVFFMNAANKDKNSRKSWMETIDAFSRLRAKHDDVLLVLHTMGKTSDGLDLEEFVQLMGVHESVKFSSQYLITAGMIPPEALRGSYGMADCYLACSKGEGFGITVLESLACGVPAIVGDNSALTEVGGPAAYRVPGEEAWMAGHRSKWMHISPRHILKAMELAYLRDGRYTSKRAKAREHALTYDADLVTEKYWAPALAALEKRL